MENETEDFDFAELPLETLEWLFRYAARSGDSVETVLWNCVQLVHDMVDYELDPNEPRTLDRNTLEGIRIALTSGDAPTASLLVIERILATLPLAASSEDKNQVFRYRVNLTLPEASGVYGHLLRILLTQGGNTSFGVFPVRLLLASWRQATISPVS
ncbi:MAG TPA: hypothetical protein VIM58_08010 [Candidatus Methylacidiphilales bacterium]